MTKGEKLKKNLVNYISSTKAFQEILERKIRKNWLETEEILKGFNFEPFQIIHLLPLSGYLY